MVSKSSAPVARHLAGQVERLNLAPVLITDPTDLPSAAARLRADLAIIDLASPGCDLRNLLTRLQAEKATETLPVILLSEETGTARIGHLQDVVDDILTPDAGIDEIGLVLRAALRRSRPQVLQGSRTFGGMRLDEASFTLHAGRTRAVLSKSEFAVLGCLFDDPGRVWNRVLLSRLLFGPWQNADSRRVDTYVSRARRAVLRQTSHDPVRAVRLEGYRLNVCTA